MLVPILLFALGLVLLIKGGDWFVDGASGIAKRFHLPELLIGATVVSIGTTLPEVMVSSQAALQGSGQIAYGNAIGSIICNVALISAITMAVKPCKVDKKSFILPAAFFFVAFGAYAYMAYVNKTFPRWFGFVLLGVFVIYMVISVASAFKGRTTLEEKAPEEEEDSKFDEKHPKWAAFKGTVWYEIIILVIGAALIAWGADLLVDNGILIAQGFGVPESVIALTFVALGTSLPELVTAITSLVKGHGALSIGNIVGANLFNIILVNGMAVTLRPFDVPSAKQFMGYDASLLVEIPLALLVMIIMVIPPLVKGKVNRAQGIILLCLYAAFCVFQFCF